MSKSRIFWTDSTGKERDIPEKATVTLVAGSGAQLRVWNGDDGICSDEVRGPGLEEDLVEGGLTATYTVTGSSEDVHEFVSTNVRNQSIAHESWRASSDVWSILKYFDWKDEENTADVVHRLKDAINEALIDLRGELEP